MRVDPGFDYRNVLALNVGVARAPGKRLRRGREARRGRTSQQMLEAVGRVPGVELAGAVAGGLPLTGSWSRTSVELPGRAEARRETTTRSIAAPCRPSYLQAAADPAAAGPLPHRRGSRGLAARRSSINEAAARKYWPGAGGARSARHASTTRSCTVVGIVGDIRHLGPEIAAAPGVLHPAGAGRRHRRDARDAHGRRPAGGAAGGQGRDLVGQQGSAALGRYGDARGATWIA